MNLDGQSVAANFGRFGVTVLTGTIVTLVMAGGTALFAGTSFTLLATLAGGASLGVVVFTGMIIADLVIHIFFLSKKLVDLIQDIRHPEVKQKEDLEKVKKLLEDLKEKLSTESLTCGSREISDINLLRCMGIKKTSIDIESLNFTVTKGQIKVEYKLNPNTKYWDEEIIDGNVIFTNNNICEKKDFIDAFSLKTYDQPYENGIQECAKSQETVNSIKPLDPTNYPKLTNEVNEINELCIEVKELLIKKSSQYSHNLAATLILAKIINLKNKNEEEIKKIEENFETFVNLYALMYPEAAELIKEYYKD